MAKLRWIAVGCMAAGLLLVTPVSARQSAPATVMKERCCFELAVSVSSDIAAEYPCDPPGYDCVYPPLHYPNGGHFFRVDWAGHEIVSYRESPNGRPLLGEVFAGQARILATATDSGAFEVSDNPDEDRSCAVVKSTLPTRFDSNPKHGWMKTETLADFVAPTGSLEVHAGLALEHVFGSTCGLGIDHHGENASRAAWGGLNEPWLWDLRQPFSRNQWRHGRNFHAVVQKTLPPRVLQSGDFCWDQGTRSALVIAFFYFPKSQLAAHVRTIDRLYPITAKKLHTVENQMRSGFVAGPGAEHCNG